MLQDPQVMKTINTVNKKPLGMSDTVTVVPEDDTESINSLGTR